MSGAFDLLDRPLVYIPIVWNGLMANADESAKVVEHKVQIQVEILDRDAFADWIIQANTRIERKADEWGAPDPEDKRTDAEIKSERFAHELSTFRQVAKAWRGIKSNGKTPEFSDDNISKLLLWPGFVTAFGEQYMEAWRGILRTREGNLEGSPAIGQAGEPTAETPKAASSPTS